MSDVFVLCETKRDLRYGDPLTPANLFRLLEMLGGDLVELTNVRFIAGTFKWDWERVREMLDDLEQDWKIDLNIAQDPTHIDKEAAWYREGKGWIYYATIRPGAEM